MIVITGSPGVGKHTLAKYLAAELGMEVVDVNKVAINTKSYKKSGRTLDVDTKKLAHKIKNIITNDTILVGHLAPYVVSRRQVGFALILRKSPYKLFPVYKKRGYSNAKAQENAASEILGITAYDAIKSFGPSKTAQLDMTGIGKREAAEKALRILKRKKGDDVDWLDMVSKRKDLERFFK
jgi:adenylate kinase